MVRIKMVVQKSKEGSMRSYAVGPADSARGSIKVGIHPSVRAAFLNEADPESFDISDMTFQMEKATWEKWVDQCLLNEQGLAPRYPGRYAGTA